MKKLFVILYTVISTYIAPCPDDNPGCLVYHGEVTDTSTVEVLTTDTLKMAKIIKSHPDAVVDTFLLYKP